MIKCASVYTREVDFSEMAYEEINTQLNSQITLLKNTVGIVLCHTEFIDTGVLSYICKNLPFDIAGVTTASQVVNGEVGDMLLTIFVMTSDDVWFRTGVTESLNEDIAEPVAAAYEKATGGISEKPKLALIFPPLIVKYAGDAYINAWSELIPNTPLYGPIAIDDTIGFEGSETIYKGDAGRTVMSFILCYGNINPRFLVGTLPADNLMPYHGEITSSEGPFVYEINNKNTFEYFEELGLVSKGSPTNGFLFVAFMIDLKKRKDYDGVQIMRGLVEFTDNGSAIFRGNVDQNSVFTLSQFSADDVVYTTLEKVNEINRMEGVNGVLSFSCIIRRMVMGANPLRELENYKENINTNIPFLMGYAGGEICPTSLRNGIPANRFHNYTFITLII